MLRRTFTTPRVLDWPDGFAGLFRLDDQIGLLSRRYRDPVLVASTDGVGTKLKLAFATGRHATVGIDLVAMSVNDCLCAGAEPLIFLDYVAMSRDDPALTRAVVQGISDGCIEAECALLGGETAILPDFYQPGEYDLAGFCVGVVERKRFLDGNEIRALATRSSAWPARACIPTATASPARSRSITPGLRPTHVEAARPTVADEFLEPTRIYVRAGQDGLPPLPGQADRARDRPHHRRRPDRQPPAHPSRGLRHPAPTRVVGRSRRSSPGSSGSATSPTRRCSASSTWGSASS